MSSRTGETVGRHVHLPNKVWAVMTHLKAKIGPTVIGGINFNC